MIENGDATAGVEGNDGRIAEIAGVVG